jgi:glycosylphosphatidylinositol phospholipase D
MKPCLCLGLPLLTLVWAASPAHADGLVTHLEVSQRAQARYDLDAGAPQRELPTKHPDAFQAGTLFPDWGFTPGPDGKQIHAEAAEFAHWTPFLKEATAYLRARPRPWDVASEKLAAFLMGVLSHATADVYWHSMACASPQGFLQAMADDDFVKNYTSFGSIDTPLPPPPPGARSAHIVGDSGGDPLVAYRLPLTWMSTEFYFPLDDLLAIYAAVDRTRPEPRKLRVTREQLRSAFATQHAYVAFFRTLEQSPFARELVERSYYPYVASWSPFLIERFENYTCGGLDDSASFTAARWRVLAEWFERAPREGSFRNDADLMCPGDGNGAQASNATGAHGHEDGWRALQARAPEAAAHLRKLRQEVRIAPWGRGVRVSLGSSPARTDAAAPELTADPAAYAYAGSSLAVSRGRRPGAGSVAGDFNHDGLDDVAVGVPGWARRGAGRLGAVQVYFGKATRPDGPLTAPDQVLEGSLDDAGFGSALAVLDFNADGFDDLAVAAPRSGAATLAYQGRIFIYLGAAERVGVEPAPSFVLEAPAARTGFGEVLQGVDCNADGFADLLVGSPFATSAGQVRAGRIDVFLSSAGRRPGTPVTPAFSRLGERRADGFGQALAVAWRASDQRRLLLVGAPGVKRDGRWAAGAVLGFDITPLANGGSPSPNALFTVYGSESYGRLGTALAVGQPVTGQVVAALAAPGAGSDARQQAGLVALAPLDALRGELALDALTTRARLRGTQRFARFGFQVAFSDLDGDGLDECLVSEPFAVRESGVDSGGGYLWRGGARFPSGEVDSGSATRTFAGRVRRAQLGRSLAVLDGGNTGRTPRLLLGAPHTPTAQPQVGAVLAQGIALP